MDRVSKREGINNEFFSKLLETRLIPHPVPGFDDRNGRLCKRLQNVRRKHKVVEGRSSLRITEHL